MYISQVSTDDGLYEPKRVNELIKTFVCVTVTPPFLFVTTINRTQYKKLNIGGSAWKHV
jgi:hypothetical protein